MTAPYDARDHAINTALVPVFSDRHGPHTERTAWSAYDELMVENARLERETRPRRFAA